MASHLPGVHEALLAKASRKGSGPASSSMNSSSTAATSENNAAIATTLALLAAAATAKATSPGEKPGPADAAGRISVHTPSQLKEKPTRAAGRPPSLSLAPGLEEALLRLQCNEAPGLPPPKVAVVMKEVEKLDKEAATNAAAAAASSASLLFSVQPGVALTEPGMAPISSE